jgi:hypothetical protein
MAKGRRAASRLAYNVSSAHVAATDSDPNTSRHPGRRANPPVPTNDPARILGAAVIPCLIVLLGLAATPVIAATLVVDKAAGPFFTIGSAISVAAANDTIEVHPGTYSEELRPSVPLTIRGSEGADSTFVRGGDYRRVLELENSTLLVEGLTFERGRAETIGGAVLCSNGTFDALRCVFRDNHVTSLNYDPARGGAVGYSGEGAGSFVDCLFIHNAADNPNAGWGGAVGIDGHWGGSRPAAATSSGNMAAPRFQFLNCSFLSNRARATAAIWSNELVEVQNCLFFDKGPSFGTFVEAPDWSVFGCNIYQDLLTPQIEDPPARRANDVEVQVDPRICPDDETSVHESSPLWSDWNNCGRIGSLPVGCTGPMAVGVTPHTLQPAADERIRVYGYGLEEVLDARLDGPHGERIPSKILTIEGPWVTLGFDLVGQARGIWALVLRTATAGEIHAADIGVGPVEIWGFFDGWVPAPTLYEGTITGRDLWEGLQLRLEHSGDGTPVVPIEILQALGTDSLRVRADLRGAPEGAYDLVAVVWDGETRSVQPALYLGSPAVIRVPEDAPTVGGALAAAAPCSEIRVAAGTYEESLVIDRPVRLRGVASWPSSWLKPGQPDQRVIHVLPQAGPLTEIDGFLITGGEVVGPGAGILCEAPAMIRDNTVAANIATGAGARGAGIFAAPGARIVDNDIHYNRVENSTPNADIWSTDPETGGVAGGLFCRRCWVEGNRIENNRAPTAGGVVAEGVFRKNAVMVNDAEPYSYGAGAVRGEVTKNRFDGCCMAFQPNLIIEGPARVIGNSFTFVGGDMCSMDDMVHLTGSMDLIGNVFVGVGLRACLRTNPLREPRPGHFRMERNAFVQGAPEIEIRYDGGGGFCPWMDASGPYEAILEDSTRFACNVRDWYWPSVQIVRDARTTTCDSCLYRIEDLPPACPDTIPSYELACEPYPVLLEASGLEAVPGGVRLYWSLPLDVTVLGFDIDREVGGRAERLTAERLAACRACEYIDTSPVEGQTATYTLRIYEGGAEPTAVVLGTWDGARVGGAVFALGMPSPHPVRDRAALRFSIPAGGRTVRLELLDMGGRIVSVVKEGVFTPGTHTIAWDARDGRGAPLASGVYLLRLKMAGKAVSRKVMVLH